MLLKRLVNVIRMSLIPDYDIVLAIKENYDEVVVTEKFNDYGILYETIYDCYKYD